MMYGIPVIAYKSGGLKETVINGKNGLLVDELSPKAFVEAIKAFKKMDYEKLARSAHSGAKQYKSSIFREKMIQLALEQLNKHNA